MKSTFVETLKMRARRWLRASHDVIGDTGLQFVGFRSDNTGLQSSDSVPMARVIKVLRQDWHRESEVIELLGLVVAMFKAGKQESDK